MGDDTAEFTDTTGSTDIDTEAGGTYTAGDLLTTEITITASDYNTGELVQFRLGRDYSTESSSIADYLVVHDVVLQYTD